MKYNKIKWVIGVLSVGISAFSHGAEEVIYGAELVKDSLTFQVVSNGCTKKEDFTVEVNKGVTGQPPYQVTLKRINRDRCRAIVHGGVSIKYALNEIDLAGVREFVITNKIGNMAARQVSEEQAIEKDDVLKQPVSSLLNKPVRVYTTGDMLTEDYIENRVNIERDQSGNIVKIWFG